MVWRFLRPLLSFTSVFLLPSLPIASTGVPCDHSCLLPIPTKSGAPYDSSCRSALSIAAHHFSLLPQNLVWRPLQPLVSLIIHALSCNPLRSHLYILLGLREPLKNSGSHIDASHSRQPLVKGERLVRYEVNAVMH